LCLSFAARATLAVKLGRMSKSDTCFTNLQIKKIETEGSITTGCTLSKTLDKGKSEGSKTVVREVVDKCYSEILDIKNSHDQGKGNAECH
jgi:hypothetical protein